MNLEPAAQSLLKHAPTGDRTDLSRRQIRLEKLGNLAFLGFLFVMMFAVLGLFFAILDRLVFSGDNPLMGIVVAAFIIFAMMGAGYAFFRRGVKGKMKKVSPEESNPQFAPSGVTARLIEEREFEPIPTVTEDTTNLLPSQKRERM